MLVSMYINRTFFLIVVNMSKTARRPLTIVAGTTRSGREYTGDPSQFARGSLRRVVRGRVSLAPGQNLDRYYAHGDEYQRVADLPGLEEWPDLSYLDAAGPPPPPPPPPPAGLEASFAAGQPDVRNPLWDRLEAAQRFVKGAKDAARVGFAVGGAYNAVQNARRSYSDVAARGEFVNQVSLERARGNLTRSEANDLISQYDARLAGQSAVRSLKGLPGTALSLAMDDYIGAASAAPDVLESALESGRYLANKLGVYDPSRPSSEQERAQAQRLLDQLQPRAVTAPATIEAYHVPRRRCRGRKCRKN